MCGIGGVIRWGKVPIEEQQIGILLVGNEHRGNDASGIVIQQEDGTLDVFKKDTPGWLLIGSSGYKQFIKEKLKSTSTCVLVHARGASQGNPRDNNNNHPMYAGKAAIVHNGVIRNDTEMFKSLNLPRKADTDSDIIRAIIDENGFNQDVTFKLGRLAGSGAIAAVHPDFPGKVMLIRSGNPLNLASNDDFLWFSSEKNTLHKVCRPFVERKGLWFQSQKTNADFATMADDSCWLLGPNGLEWHSACKICLRKYEEPWRRTYQDYAIRQAKFDNKAQQQHPSKGLSVVHSSPSSLAWCEICKKDWVIPYGKDPADFTCNRKEGGCGESLSKYTQERVN